MSPLKFKGVRPKIWIPVLCLLMGLSVCQNLAAETGSKLLQPKRSTQKFKTRSEGQPEMPTELRPKNINEPPEESWGAASPLEQISFSLLFGTPLGYESFYEKRFQSFADLFLFSLPLTRLTKKLFLHLETGPGFTFARLRLTQPNLVYSHIYIVIPAHLRLIYTVTKSFHLECYAGAMARVVEFDSRDTTDGGTRFTKNGPIVSPEGGVGLSYAFNPALKARFNLGYLFLAGGLELTL